MEEEIEVVRMRLRITRLEAKVRAIEELLYQIGQALSIEVSTEERRTRSLYDEE